VTPNRPQIETSTFLAFSDGGGADAVPTLRRECKKVETMARDKQLQGLPLTLSPLSVGNGGGSAVSEENELGHHRYEKTITGDFNHMSLVPYAHAVVILILHSLQSG